MLRTNWTYPLFQAGAVVVICAGLVFAPVNYGATEVWSSCALQYMAAAAALLWILSGAARPELLILPGVVAALGALQLVPLPGWLLGLAAPLAHDANLAAHQLHVSGLPGSASVDPGMTLSALRQLLLMTMLAMAVADIARGRAFRHAILWTVVVVGLVVLVMGIRFHGGPDYLVMGDHDLSGPIHAWKNPMLPPLHTAAYGFSDVVHVGGVQYVVDWHYCCGHPVGPFLVANHFAAFMILAVPVALGLMLWLAGVAVKGTVPFSLTRKLGQSPGDSRPARLILGVAAAAVACVALVGIGMLTGSRAGLASLAMGAMVVFGLVFPPPAGKLWPRMLAAGLLLCLAAIALVAVLVHYDMAAGWMSDAQRGMLRSMAGAASGRIGAWKVAASMFFSAPMLGTGLGTYGELFTSFKSGADNWYFAHNEYAQFLGETGCAGLMAAVLAVGWIIRRIRNGWHTIRSAGERALAAGVAGALAGFTIHCMFDWSARVPANAFTLAVLLGLLMAVVRAKPSPDAQPAPRSLRCARWLAPGAALAGIALCVLATHREAAADRLAAPLRRAVMNQRVLDEKRSKGDKMEVLEAAKMTPGRKADLLAALPDAERAARLVPGSAEYAASVGQAYLHLSEGRKSPQLVLAGEWFRRSLRAFPANRELRHTLGQVDELLEPVTP